MRLVSGVIDRQRLREVRLNLPSGRSLIHGVGARANARSDHLQVHAVPGIEGQLAGHQPVCLPEGLPHAAPFRGPGAVLRQSEFPGCLQVKAVIVPWTLRPEGDDDISGRGIGLMHLRELAAERQGEVCQRAIAQIGAPVLIGLLLAQRALLKEPLPSNATPLPRFIRLSKVQSDLPELGRGTDTGESKERDEGNSNEHQMSHRSTHPFYPSTARAPGGGLPRAPREPAGRSWFLPPSYGNAYPISLLQILYGDEGVACWQAPPAG